MTAESKVGTSRNASTMRPLARVSRRRVQITPIPNPNATISNPTISPDQFTSTSGGGGGRLSNFATTVMLVGFETAFCLSL